MAKFEMRAIKGKGVGIICSEEREIEAKEGGKNGIPEGVQIFNEIPSIFLPVSSKTNAGVNPLCCGSCFKIMGSLRDHLLMQISDRIEKDRLLPLKDLPGMKSQEEENLIVECEYCSDQKYCGVQCRDLNYVAFHKLICLGDKVEVGFY